MDSLHKYVPQIIIVKINGESADKSKKTNNKTKTRLIDLLQDKKNSNLTSEVTMHKKRQTEHVVNNSGNQVVGIFTFPVTSFIAVTAYQNEEVIKSKR